MDFDAVLCVAPQHRHIAVLACRSLRLFSPAKRLFVVTAPENFGALKELAAEGLEIVPLDEDEVVEGLTLQRVQDYMRQRGARVERAGWYLQQFLKMGMCFHPQISDHYLIWDADTVVLNPVQFFDDDGRVLITPRRENHRAYFDLTRRLLGWGRSVNFSFVAEHLMVNKATMREMIEAITARFPEERSWVWAVLDSIEDRELSMSGFSEYETYGNFVHLKHPDSYRPRPLRTFRNGTRRFGPRPNPCELYYLSKRYDIVSFESYQHLSWLSFLHQARARLAYGFNHALRRSAGTDARFSAAEALCRPLGPA